MHAPHTVYFTEMRAHFVIKFVMSAVVKKISVQFPEKFIHIFPLNFDFI